VPLRETRNYPKASIATLNLQLEANTYKVSDATEVLLRSDIKTLFRDNLIQSLDVPLTGRAVARILHGIQSPVYSYELWKDHSLWGKRNDIAFKDIESLTNIMLKEKLLTNGL